MSDTILEVNPLAPLLLRDGRPFSGGKEETRAQSLPLPLPHTLAGFIRTQIGQGRGLDWQGLSDDALHRELRTLHSTPIRSLPVRDGEFMFPAPRNAVLQKPDVTQNVSGRVYRASPEALRPGEGLNTPDGLLPLTLRDQEGRPPDDSFKPDSGYTYWTQADMTTWLLGQTPLAVEKIPGPPAEERTHVAMNSETGTGDEGRLFSVTYRSFEERRDGQYHRWALRVKADVKGDVAPLGFLGGERRPATLRDRGNSGQWPNLGQFGAVKAALENPGSTRLCFILTSPALFAGGWKPGWLSLTPEEARVHSGNGLPAGTRELMAGGATLVGAALGRRVPVSGWNLRQNKPKAVRWAVPAGSVYFLEVPGSFDRQKLLDAWLKPLSDELEDQRDGFGCALWGVWN